MYRLEQNFYTILQTTDTMHACVDNECSSQDVLNFNKYIARVNNNIR